MHFTLHLTNNCNMGCKYCYVDKCNIKNMSLEIVKKSVDLSAKEGGSVGIIFFGGEPLLQKNLIYETVKYAKKVAMETGTYFHFKITTNGLLLDEEFMEFSLKEDIFIALSHDGIKEAHDSCRISLDSAGTFDILENKIEMLLTMRPYSPVMMVIDPKNIKYYFKSVEYLYNKGFRYIICSLNYSGNWNENDMKQLKEEYLKISEFYYEKTVKEDKFYLSPFEVKISSHINKENYCHERCELGMKQISVAPDGKFYPCVQFVGEEEFYIGDVDSGIDNELRMKLYNANEKEKDSCIECAIRNRCNHYCGCLNRQATGSIYKVSPVLCAHERILLPIADKLAAKLFENKNAMFIQKHYNDMFPLISAVEDKIL